MTRSVVICKLPKGGLGNQLFPLMHAFVFAHLNDLPIIVTGYNRLKIGPYLRREKNKRKYTGYFTFQKSILGALSDILRSKFLQTKYPVVREPKIEKIAESRHHNQIFVFEKMPTYHEYFIHLKQYRDETINILYSILNPWILKKVNAEEKPVIGVHVRMGDFRKLNDHEVYKGGHVRVPEEYFIKMINCIRNINGKDLAVSIFTDGYKNELKDLFKLKYVKMMEHNPDIVDMLLLSKSRVIITSHGSTFSVWAAFLSNAPIILYFEQSIRPAWLSKIMYEGILEIDNSLLIDSIKNIQ